MYSLLFLGILAALALAFVVALVVTVDDWSRDLTTNTAATAEDHPLPALRPLVVDDPPSELANRVEAAAAALPRWKVISRSGDDNGIQIHLTRTTPLWRFVDDIRVTIKPENGRTVLRATSQSRVGKGDLGQNPRNLRELLDKLRAAES